VKITFLKLDIKNNFVTIFTTFKSQVQSYTAASLNFPRLPQQAVFLLMKNGSF
jgi:hypothetical protein